MELPALALFQLHWKENMGQKYIVVLWCPVVVSSPQSPRCGVL